MYRLSDTRIIQWVQLEEVPPESSTKGYLHRIGFVPEQQELLSAHIMEKSKTVPQRKSMTDALWAPLIAPYTTGKLSRISI